MPATVRKDGTESTFSVFPLNLSTVYSVLSGPAFGS